MTNTTKLFELSQLAEAAYANLIPGNSLKDELQNADFNMKFSATQATEFAKNWEVVSHQPDTGSGYSGTLFKYIGNDPNSGFANGDLVFSQRGTAGPADLIEADLHEITENGLAFRQIIDMYNYWQRLTANEGATVHEAQLVVANPFTTPHDKLIIESALLTPFAYWTIEFEDVANAGLGKANISNLTGITGHSLGGHLADAFTRLFGGATTSINGAGFPTGLIPGLGLTAGNNIPNLFSMLGGYAVFPVSAIDNIYGDKMPQIVTMDSVFGLKQQGSTNPLFIEQPTIFGNVLGHGKEQMTDSLAVANLFIRLDNDFASQTPAQALSILNTLFEESSDQAAQSLEKLVEGLNELILGVKPTIVTDDRDSLYTAIKNLTDSITALSLTSKFTLEAAPVDPATAPDIARSDFGAFLSLYYLTPFALHTNDAGAMGTLHQLHATIADKWDADRSLTSEQIDNGEANFSDIYLKDRAAMLGWIIKANTDDTDAPSGITTEFIDKETNKTVGTGTGAGATFNNPDVIFGKNDAETISGGLKNDDLFGGGGDDQLFGLDGNDYLEGNDGNDTLYGEIGKDDLFGGSGDDILEGGKDTDQLYGGAGNDTYIHAKGDGNDNITDTDGLGKILVNGSSTALNGGKAVANTDNLWLSADHKTSYKLYDNGDGTQTLNIYLGTERLFVKNWVDGDLGINLQDATPPVTLAPVSFTTQTTDTEWFNNGNGNSHTVLTGIGTGSLTATGNYGEVFGQGQITGNDSDNYLQSTDGDSTIEGGAGRDMLFAAGSGNHTLNGGDGDDVVYGGGQDDVLAGEANNDVLSGGLGGDVLLGGAGNDYLFGGGIVVAQNFDWSATPTLFNKFVQYVDALTGQPLVDPTQFYHNPVTNLDTNTYSLDGDGNDVLDVTIGANNNEWRMAA